MSSHSTDPAAPITRREAIRRTVVFSAGALLAARRGIAQPAPAQTNFSPRGLHLLAFGDYGTRGDAKQTAVARAMATFAQSLGQPLTAVLALGDNFYHKLTPDRFENHFENMYAAEALNCPFYACVGNHDYGTAHYDFQKGKLQMQLDYAKNHPTSRWKLPAKWYPIELRSNGSPLVKIIVLDGNYWWGALTPKEKLAQRQFLQAELKKPTDAPWLWVVNHFPLFSDDKSRGDNKTLISEWGKHLQKHPVSLCISGHDHTMQHLQVEGYHASFIISGAGGANLYPIQPTGRGYVTNHHLGFNHIHVTPEEVQVQYISAAGDCLHRFHRDLTGNINVLT